MGNLVGGCLCGAVRYHCDEEPLVTVICHCHNCQKYSGGAHSVNILVPRNSLRVDGELSVYVDQGDSGGKVMRYFCGACGSAISSAPGGIDTFEIIKAGTLDETSQVHPTMEIYCDSAQDWAKLGGEIESHPKMIPAF